ncbi:MAG: four helix bundle protein [Bacteroidia bacterium]
MPLIQSHRDLLIYQKSVELGMTIFEISKDFPSFEIYSLTDQMRRSSRSVSANITEAWRKRRYERSFVAKLADADGEAGETQTWLEYGFKCGYIPEDKFTVLFNEYEILIGMIVRMMKNSSKWTLP